MSNRNNTILGPQERARAVAAVRRSAGDHLAGLGAEVAKLDGVPDRNALQRIVVHAHTLGGAARITRLDDVAGLAAAIEAVVCDPAPPHVAELRRLKALVADLGVRIGRRATVAEPVSPGRVVRRRLATPAARSAA
jgi:hypothetical protein